ncbi:Membrane-bound lytic murein transglycosylase A precursor [Candidatus Nitrotoga sp. BS]|uniref:murein transglycosylase A n=1 Tax=Candidatus Nitrotoga sp. BS TaxID=2890408 RepID=UPI001EF2D972|nr:MltA domain-containing protein [Candidatus Nitrotoga sp. BS]CAH1189467.1 Membrane-bound lytic murein transglycosylase A precursor [Candidatus Nitrotoga sp. BS]
MKKLNIEINKKWLALVLSVFLAACTTVSKPPVVSRPQPVTPPPKVMPAPTAGLPAPLFIVSKWEMLPDWQTLDLALSQTAFLQSCRVLKNKPHWQEVCVQAEQLGVSDNATLHAFYEEWFTPYQVLNPDGSEQGMITGYYEPLLKGSRFKTPRFQYPLYAAPNDLLTIDLGGVYPQLKDLRLRGRLQGKRIVPYYNRAEIDAGAGEMTGNELFWVENEIELFFLHIQGSGRIELPDGKQVKVGYADQNGHPYQSIGKRLVETGELKLEEASMQGIKGWAEKNPDKIDMLLEHNPSYVFLRELPDSLSAPLGALGVPLTNEYSIAVDRTTIPLGAPVFLATTYPNDSAPLNRLMLAQDTGGAIKGAVRADFFWGFGESAGTQAGKMKQQGRLWVLFPKGAEPMLN